MKNLTLEELTKYLSEILSCDAFELHADAEYIYIPYMMNDALECYLLFSNTQLTGRYLPDFEGKTSFELTQTPQTTGIIFRQGAENDFTLWFSDCRRILRCYRYDQIGHFWVKGEEHWRRLVYIIGTIRDKYEYMGEALCNEAEIALTALMEFAPFRMYSPIHKSKTAAFFHSGDPLGAVYPDTLQGISAMESLAKEAGDRTFCRLLSIYRRFPCWGMKKLLFWALNCPGRIPLYELLFKKVQDAASAYPNRDYGPERNARITQARIALARQLKDQGFSGEYPLFQKGNHQILAMEEHPFTVLEASDFQFRIQLMESETSASDLRINAGFFRKWRNRSRITKE